MSEEKRNYNESHPEMEEGEMFLTNYREDEPYVYIRIGWTTKRKGRQAYTIQGNALKYYTPVFVQKKEYVEGMREYNEEKI